MLKPSSKPLNSKLTTKNDHSVGFQQKKKSKINFKIYQKLENFQKNLPNRGHFFIQRTQPWHRHLPFTQNSILQSNYPSLHLIAIPKDSHSVHKNSQISFSSKLPHISSLKRHKNLVKNLIVSTPHSTQQKISSRKLIKAFFSLSKARDLVQ